MALEVTFETLSAQIDDLGQSALRIKAERDALLSVAKRWAALNGGSWNTARHVRETDQLLNDTRAAIAKVEA